MTNGDRQGRTLTARALQATTVYQRAAASWRGERRMRADSRVGMREHLPAGELHWPCRASLSWAGECWAIETELTRETVAHTTGIMRELLARTGDYGCPAA
jgi:hypothetical protein